MNDNPTNEQIAQVKRIFDALDEMYSCSDCIVIDRGVKVVRRDITSLLRSFGVGAVR